MPPLANRALIASTRPGPLERPNLGRLNRSDTSGRSIEFDCDPGRCVARDSGLESTERIGLDRLPLGGRVGVRVERKLVRLVRGVRGATGSETQSASADSVGHHLDSP
jgi:hypothetical protein